MQRYDQALLSHLHSCVLAGAQLFVRLWALLTSICFQRVGRTHQVMRSRLIYSLAAIVMLGATPSALGETMYITDILRLGIHRSPDTSDKAFKILTSGDALEILEKNTFYARVRTVDGDEGWVKYSYLVSEKPSQAMLLELTNERDQLTAELATLRNQQSGYDSTLATLRDERDLLQQSVDSDATQISALTTERDSLTAQLDAKRFSIPLKWLVLTGLAALVGGFVGGWWWTDAKQRARHGGYRI